MDSSYNLTFRALALRTDYIDYTIRIGSTPTFLYFYICAKAGVTAVEHSVKSFYTETRTRLSPFLFQCSSIWELSSNAKISSDFTFQNFFKTVRPGSITNVGNEHTSTLSSCGFKVKNIRDQHWSTQSVRLVEAPDLSRTKDILECSPTTTCIYPEAKLE